MKRRPPLVHGPSRPAGLLMAALVVLAGCSREIGAESQVGVPALAAALHAGQPTAAPALPPAPAATPEHVAPGAGVVALPAPEVWTSVLHSERDAEVATRVPGTVASVSIELGDRVRAGQLLATLRDEAEQAALEAARAALDLARLEHERASGLREQNLVTQAELDQATYRVRVAAAALREAEVRHEYTRIRAPFDGAVTRRFVRVGQSVEEREPIARVTALRPLRTLVRVPEAVAQSLTPGQPLRLRGLGGEGVEGRISRIAPAVDPVGGTVEVLVEVPQPGSLRPGSAVTIEPSPAAGPPR